MTAARVRCARVRPLLPRIHRDRDPTPLRLRVPTEREFLEKLRAELRERRPRPRRFDCPHCESFIPAY